MAKEIRSFWDINTLTEYGRLQQIPRGLRIKKFPTFDLHNDKYKTEWTNALSDCSFKLIQIIIDSRTEELTQLRDDISVIQQSLTPLQQHKDFTGLDTRLNKNLDRLEKSVISGKNDKLARDHMDYENSNVYIWKKPTYANRSRKHSQKRVSFSDLDNDSINDTMAATASDSSPDPPGRSTNVKHQLGVIKTPCLNTGAQGSTKKKKLKPSRKQEGAAKDTDGATKDRYTLRDRFRK